MKQKKRGKDAGFSLIELIVVIAMMAVLIAVIAPALSGYIGKSKKRSDEYNAEEIQRIINYEVENDIVNEEDAVILQNLRTNFDSKIFRIDYFLKHVDNTGTFQASMEKQLGHNNFDCKRAGYHYYVQVVFGSDYDYEVICRSVKAQGNSLSQWPEG